MSSRKCPKCGLVSFATTENCNRCKASLKVSDERATAKTSFVESETYETKSRRVFSPLRVLLLVLLFAIPVWYYYQGIEPERAADEKKQNELRREHTKLTCPTCG